MTNNLPSILRSAGAPVLALVAALASGPALAEGLDLAGSLGDGGFSRYVPPVTNPLFNETPFITTEARPIYIYHHIPDDFLTGGGTANVVALQARVAITERLGFIATADGYSWLDFDNTLPDDSGLNDITAGLKYAVISDAEAGSIATLGARYTIPVGTLRTGGLELNGTGNGYVDVFATAAQLMGASPQRIIGRHLLPSFASHLIASATPSIPSMILGETALSFLGLGLRPPITSWGVLLAEAQNINVVALYPWLMIPVIPVIIVVLAFNFLGDGLRDAADPYK